MLPMNTNQLLADNARPIVPLDQRQLIDGAADFVRQSFLGRYTTKVPKQALAGFDNWGMRAIITGMTDPMSARTSRDLLVTEGLLLAVPNAATVLFDPKFNWVTGRKWFKQVFGVEIFLEHSLPCSIAFKEILGIGDELLTPEANDRVSAILECVKPVWMLSTERWKGSRCGAVFPQSELIHVMPTLHAMCS
jgi:hypothetical protein